MHIAITTVQEDMEVDDINPNSNRNAFTLFVVILCVDSMFAADVLAAAPIVSALASRIVY